MSKDDVKDAKDEAAKAKAEELRNARVEAERQKDIAEREANEAAASYQPDEPEKDTKEEKPVAPTVDPDYGVDQ